MIFCSKILIQVLDFDCDSRLKVHFTAKQILYKILEYL